MCSGLVVVGFFALGLSVYSLKKRGDDDLKNIRTAMMTEKQEKVRDLVMVAAKELAKQTAQATVEIKKRVGSIQGSTEQTVAKIEQISSVVHAVNEIVSTIAAAVEEQSATTKEIADSVTQASQGIQEITENVAQSSTVAGEIAKDIANVNEAAGEMSNSTSQVHLNAEEVSKLAGELKEMVGQFKV